MCHLRKLDPNESVSLDRFAFVRWYVGKEVSMVSVEEAERLVGWGCKIRLIDLQLSGSFTEEVMVSVNDIFEVGFNFAASGLRNKFNGTASEDWGAIRYVKGSRYRSITGNL